MTNFKQPIVIGITGGSGSGKTTLAREIAKQIGNREHILVIKQDAYYKDNANLTMKQRLQINYDEPAAFDFDLLNQQLQSLLNRQAIQQPVYDFAKHTRSNTTHLIKPADIIILEGILTLFDQKLRDLMKIKIFVDTDDDVRLIRRLKRDTKERGRSPERVIKQYLSTVKPMYHKFISPTKYYADIIVPRGGQNRVAIDILTNKIHKILDN